MKTGRPEIDDADTDWVIGSDEVGYGSWAGPLVVVGTALPRGWSDPKVTDSKKMSKTAREDAVVRWTVTTPVIWEVAQASSDLIDTCGVWNALLEAHHKVLTRLQERVQGTRLVVVDGFKDGADAIQIPGAIGLPKADTMVPAVSLASIIAKVGRDKLMEKFAVKYPGYGFERHVGYGTPEHQAALVRLGPCPIHRRSYSPIAKYFTT